MTQAGKELNMLFFYLHSKTNPPPPRYQCVVNVYFLYIFYLSAKTHDLGTQKNPLNEAVLLSTKKKQQMLKSMDKKFFSSLRS